MAATSATLNTWTLPMPEDSPDYAALEALEKAATPGPWRVTENLDYWVTAAEPEAPIGDDEPLVAHCGDIHWPNYEEKQPEWRSNAELIAALRNAAPALIAQAREAEALRARVEELEEELKPFAEQAEWWLGEPDDLAVTMSDGAECSSLDFRLSDLRRAARLLAKPEDKT